VLYTAQFNNEYFVLKFHSVSSCGKDFENMDVGEAFRILGIKSDATDAEVKEAYRDCVAISHPDRQTNPRRQLKATEQLKLINLAYEMVVQFRKGRVPMADKYQQGSAAQIILDIIRRETRQKASTMGNLLDKVKEEEDAGAFLGTRIRPGCARERLITMMGDYCKRRYVERSGNLYKAI
jgi:hypothetical protein